MEKKEKIKLMTKNEMIKEVSETLKAKGLELNGKQVDEVLLAYEQILLMEWKEKGEFKLLNIGKFKTVHRAAREGINPMTKAPIKIAAKTVPKFAFNKAVKEFILGNVKK